MQKYNKQAIRLALIGFASALLILAINVADNTTTYSINEQHLHDKNLKPSAYLTDSTFNIFNDDGKLSTLHAQKAFFYTNKDTINIDSPSFSTKTKSSDVLLTAEKGYYLPSKQTLMLEGNVLAKQKTANQITWELSSDTLKVDNEMGILSTPDKITLSNGPHTLSAVGFEASLDDKEIKLQSRVRGKYVLSKD